MCLIREPELLLLTHVVNVSCIVLLNSIFGALILTLCFDWLYLLSQMVVLCEELVSVNSCNYVDRDVGSLVLKTSMHINVGVN
jgi:hypothetical protein